MSDLVCMKCKSERAPKEVKLNGVTRMICYLCGHHGKETFTPAELFADKPDLMSIWNQPKYEGVRVY